MVAALIKVLMFLTFCSMLFPQNVNSTFAINNNNQSYNKILNPSCAFVPGLLVGNKTQVEECCNITTEKFYSFLSEFNRKRFYLTTFLLTLQSWNCLQYQQECEKRFFDINQYTAHVYDYFCNFTKFVDECFSSVVSTYNSAVKRTEPLTYSAKLWNDTSFSYFATSSPENYSKTTEWYALTRTLNSSILSADELVKPCVQVALYDAEKEFFGDYVELTSFLIPFCPLIWCGFDGNSIRNRYISFWNCLENQCRVNLIIIMITCGLLAIMTTFANLSVIMFYKFNPSFLSSQGIFKLSLAGADLLVGIVVFPTFICSLLTRVVGRIVQTDIINVTGYEIVDGRKSENITELQIHISNRLDDLSDHNYLNFVGFITYLSLFVSIYCLIAASLDRLYAIVKPLRYDSERATKLAKWSSIGIWGFGLVLAILPIVTENKFKLNASILVGPDSLSFKALSVILLIFPICLLWIANIALLYFVRKFRQPLTIDPNINARENIRLSTTLFIMVGAFTFSFLPIAIVVPLPYIYELLNIAYFNYTTNFIAAFSVASIILASNSLWNYFIYNARHAEFRKSVKVIHKKLCECF